MAPLRSVRLERELVRARRALAAVERMLRGGSPTPYDVTIRNEPARAVLCLDATTTDEREIEDTTALVDRLLALAGEAEVAWKPPVFCLLPEVRDQDEFAIRVGIAVDGTAGDVADARLDVLRGGPCAMVLHVGGYEELALAHHAILAWVQERGHTEVGPLREYYIDDPREVDVANLRTEVLLPIATRC